MREEYSSIHYRLPDLQKEPDTAAGSDIPPMELEGDLIITDPMYVMGADGNDWQKCGYGFRMEALGFRRYRTADTLWGDWNCEAYDPATGRILGSFCADSGLVSVFLLEEILQYNPAYREHLTRPDTAAWIRHFRGTVRFAAVPADAENETGTLSIIGQGIHTVTGEELCFATRRKGN